ncbi:LAMI_0E03422g1_1 [Lachancea mirantina]|uniref:LAMI_0E03422g1_1 n=1 Tax=Lachancea mirantina TaxID=1230905 RepID=A0A1G4JJN0_9SACH|nr:LAMI_0E03422g1_1 [Lachancea mirantina]
MDPFAFFVVFVIVVIVVLFLPLLSGIGSYRYKKPQFTGKNFQNREKARSAREKVKDSLKLSREQNPVKFQLKDELGPARFEMDSKTGLKRRNVGVYSKDPNDYDYDVDQLIQDEIQEEKREERARYAKFEGKEQEENEALV